MKILFFALGNEEVASSRTRVYQYLPYFEKMGIEYKVIFYTAPWQFKRIINMRKEDFFLKLLGKLYNYLKATAFVILAAGYNILFIQRVLLPIWIQKVILRLNPNIIFDFDDAIYLCDKAKKERGVFWRKNKFLPRLEYIVKFSKYVLLENDYTKTYAQNFNKNILLITGPIDVRRYSPKQKDAFKKEVVLGWIGSPTTAIYLESLYRVFEEISKRYADLSLELIGVNKPFNLNGVKMTTKAWSLDTEVSDLQNFDIGLMPLYDDEWSKGKGGYKLLQYMAMGIPAVASPVGINREIIKDGVNGFLADSQSEWIEKLSRLIEDSELRLKMGREGRKLAEELYSYEISAPQLVKALRTLL